MSIAIVMRDCQKGHHESCIGNFVLVKYGHTESESCQCHCHYQTRNNRDRRLWTALRRQQSRRSGK